MNINFTVPKSTTTTLLTNNVYKKDPGTKFIRAFCRRVSESMQTMEILYPRFSHRPYAFMIINLQV